MNWYKYIKREGLTLEQKLLLQAIFLPVPEAIASWQQWRAKVDLDYVDGQSFQLLGLLSEKLSDRSIEDSYLPRLKGIYRQNWYVNQQLLKKLSTVLVAFKQLEIKTILLADTAVIVQGDRDHYGRRRLKNLQLLIPVEDVPQAFTCLSELQWQPTSTTATSTNLIAGGYVDFKHEQQQTLRLQSHLFWAIPQEHTNSQLWQYAVPSQINELPCWFPSPTDLLLNCCVIKRQHYQSSLFTNLANLLTILTTQDVEIDWVRLINQAQRYQLILPLRKMLSLTTEIVPVSIPDWVLPALHKMAISHWELKEYHVPFEPKLLWVKAIVLRMININKNLRRSLFY